MGEGRSTGDSGFMPGPRRHSAGPTSARARPKRPVFPPAQRERHDLQLRLLEQEERLLDLTRKHEALLAVARRAHTGPSRISPSLTASPEGKL